VNMWNLRTGGRLVACVLVLLKAAVAASDPEPAAAPSARTFAPPAPASALPAATAPPARLPAASVAPPPSGAPAISAASQRAFDSLVQGFQANNWKFARTTIPLMIQTGFTGKNGQYTCFASVRPDTPWVTCCVRLAFVVAEQKRTTIAQYFTRLNAKMGFGDFEMAYGNGAVWYKTAIALEDAQLTPRMVKSLILVNINTVDANVPEIIHTLSLAPAATVPMPALLGQRGAERFGEMLHGPRTAEVHAGLLSGLALAGANRAGQAEARDVLAENDSDDGILTAEELGTQNLDGVQLVVLSACETGLGKAAAGEGLLGLQRAFQSAGARTVVASLWSVPDNETRMLMEAFYTNLWTRKQGALDSLRQAQLAMLHGGGKAGQLRGAERDIEDDHSGHARFSPRYWAAFVLSGDWR